MAKAFTPEQITQLRSNPYTYKVSEKKILFTKEFKELFYQKRQEGLSVKEILISSGYDPEVLGEGRISGLCCQVNKAMKKEGLFREGIRPRNSILAEDDPEFTRENFLRMQHEVQLLRQEMDFIKKISSVEDSGK